MNNFMVFLHKEFMEMWRDKRAVILAAVFVFFGVLSPVMMRYMNELFALLMSEEELAMMGIGAMEIPHWTASYVGFFGNLNQVGMIALILLAMGVIVSEKRRGTAALMMVKGLGHKSFVLSKFAVWSINTFVVLLVAIAVNHALTIILWGEGAQLGNLISGFLMYWVFAMMMIALVILTSTIAKSLAISAVFGFLGFMLLSIPASLPRIQDAFPYTLSFRASDMVASGYFPTMAWANIATAILTTALFLGISIAVLRKKEL